MKTKLKQWWSPIPPISTKWTITSHLKSWNIKTLTYEVGNPDHVFYLCSWNVYCKKYNILYFGFYFTFAICWLHLPGNVKLNFTPKKLIQNNIIIWEAVNLTFYAWKITWYQKCCVVWGNCSNEGLNRILKLQKRIARLILYQDPIAPSEPLFKQLGWMSIEQRIKYHKYLLVSKCLRMKHLYIQKKKFTILVWQKSILSPKCCKWKITNPKGKNWTF